MMKVSLILPTYNKLPRLKLALTSLQVQTYPVDNFEVIVVDDGSSDGTREYLAETKFPFSLRYIFQQNSGRAAARNRGVQAVASDVELLIFVDDDLILSPGFIAEHVRVQKEEPGVVHGKIVNITYLKFFLDPTQGIFYPFLERNTAGEEMLKKCICSEDILQRFDESIGVNRKTTPLEKVIAEVLTSDPKTTPWIGFTGGNLSIPKAWFLKMGGFDENFGLKWGCEDLELGYRLAQAGYPFFYQEQAVNYHLAHYRPNFDQEHAVTAQYFYEKHGDPKILVLQDFIEGRVNKAALMAELRKV